MEKSISTPPLSVGELVEIKVNDSGYNGWIRAIYIGHSPGINLPYRFTPVEETPPIETWGLPQLNENRNWRRLPN